MVQRSEVALEVHVHHCVPVILGHVDEHAVTQIAGVVDQHVQVTEGLDGLVDHVLGASPVRHIVVVGDCLATHGHDLGRHLLRRGAVFSRAVEGPAEVVHDDLGPL